MDYYIDITIKPDAEMRENVLLNKVYTKLHKYLWSIKSIDIGISFPLYSIKLGKKIRIHSSYEVLKKLENIDWIGGLSGYCNIKPIKEVPADVVYRNISRVQSNMTQAKLRRLIKRGTIPEQDIKRYKAQLFTKSLDEPYLELESSSNGQLHRRYLRFGELKNNLVSGVFDSFGLSKDATVPWF